MYVTQERDILLFACPPSNPNPVSSLHHLDINECVMENDCHVNATCMNTDGSYNCSCMNGTEGDGYSCEGTAVVNIFL